VSGAAIFFLITVLAIPGLRTMFQFAPIHSWELILLIVAAVCCIFVAESIKIKPIKRFIFGQAE
jgi:hypothetical protein